MHIFMYIVTSISILDICIEEYMRFALSYIYIYIYIVGAVSINLYGMKN